MAAGAAAQLPDAHLQSVRPAKPGLGSGAEGPVLLLATAPGRSPVVASITRDPRGEVADGGGQPTVVEHPAVRGGPGQHYLGRYARRLQARRSWERRPANLPVSGRAPGRRSTPTYSSLLTRPENAPGKITTLAMSSQGNSRVIDFGYSGEEHKVIPA